MKAIDEKLSTSDGLLKLNGKVSKIRFSTETSGSENHTSTSNVAVFEIDGKPVELKLYDSIVIENGHHIAVAGNMKNGLFKAMAYHNLTNGVSGKGATYIFFILGIIFFIVGLIASIPTNGIGLIFSAVGAYLIYQSNQYSKAYELVTEDNENK